jgi:hypothetical protein
VEGKKVLWILPVVGDTGEPEDDHIPGEWRAKMFYGYFPL